MKEVEVAQNEVKSAKPIKGEVADVIAKVGEIVPQGVPIVDPDRFERSMVVLNVGAKMFSDLPSANFTGELPALTENGANQSKRSSKSTPARFARFCYMAQRVTTAALTCVPLNQGFPAQPIANAPRHERIATVD